MAALAESTQKLIRQFSKRENQLLLKTFDHKTKDESEIQTFMESWGKLGELVTNWLNTPQEEVKSNEIQRERLEGEVKGLLVTAKEAQEKYRRETAEHKKRQEENLKKSKLLRESIGEERAHREKLIQEAEEDG